MSENAVIETLLTARLVLRSLRREDASVFRDYELRNRERFAPHGPLRTDEDFLPAAFDARVETMLRDVDSGASCRWVMRLRDEPQAVIGHVVISAIQRGVRHAGFLGYGLDAAHEGQGLMSEALVAALAHAFDVLNLHRVEATHRPENMASARVLAKQGFVREGLARDYICLDGVWQDSVLNGLCNPRWRSSPVVNQEK
ncbi:GNAT family N-acetyltransferase [Uliginosibacterium sp. H3]|uniref:GNAT family N-acetyltransferase n=1 Tax=Uliginosibacterium silvisoli TaxID=3114758 RepID=A0ABU6JZ21_9RHOO|nr:GNAT family N-acetyltransferase [Uliginosibacterium sp. H3]